MHMESVRSHEASNAHVLAAKKDVNEQNQVKVPLLRLS